jgi:hypothetical protein
MCKLISNIDAKTATGYKVAVEVDGRYLSPATLVEYAPGPVPGLPSWCDFNDKYNELNERFYISRPMFLHDSIIMGYANNERMTGYTAVFTDKEAAHRLAEQCREQSMGLKIVVLRMKLKAYDDRGLIAGTYEEDDVVLGQWIESIEKVSVYDAVVVERQYMGLSKES